MKKVITLTLLVLGLALTGCNNETDEGANLSELQASLETLETQVTGLETDLATANTTLGTLQSDLEDAEDEIGDLDTALTTSNTTITDLQEALEAAATLANTKLKNVYGRDSWLLRKVAYDASWVASDAEYCFGVFDEDWSTIVADDYAYNGGLKFVITIEAVQFGTEYLAKDSCGNYSEFIFSDSPYGLYSMPAGHFEVGETYSVVLYKDIYFTVPQLGLLPAADMGAFGSYPEDLSGITSELIE